jgi:indole-3-glycerol phosphate synthase
VFCNDFVVYGYQLFRAKSSGADAVKLMASVLSTQDIEYLLKIAKALGLLCIVVVSSKVQLLDVLRAVPTVQALSVSSRNMRLWKIDAGKAARILKDPEVAAAIAAKRRDAAAAATTAAAAAPGFSEGDFILMQEAFTSHAELVEAGTNGVDAVILGEELLLGKEAGIKATIEQWKLQTAP